MVCLGNICRSPTAHGVFQNRIENADLADKIHVDCSGTGNYHIGEKPDLPAVCGMALIIAGVAVINVFSKSAGH